MARRDIVKQIDRALKTRGKRVNAVELERLLRANPSAWDHKYTARIAEMYGASIPTTLRVLKKLVDEGFERPGGGTLRLNDHSYEGLKKGRGSCEHYLWLFM
jgi:hypothetical protein